MIRIAIIGAEGAMGQAVQKVIAKSPTLYTAAALIGKISKPLASIYSLQTAPMDQVDIFIDFSTPSALLENLKAAILANRPMVIGTTGFTDLHHEALHKTAQHIPLLYSPNFSIGIALIKKFFHTYRALFSSAYVDIFESHHLHKKDLPSGTSLDLANSFTDKTKLLTTPTPRQPHELVIHSLRLPQHPGEHTVQCSFDHETISFSHQAKDRCVYARGALLAADFLVRKPPGLYAFSQVVHQQD